MEKRKKKTHLRRKYHILRLMIWVRSLSGGKKPLAVVLESPSGPRHRLSNLTTLLARTNAETTDARVYCVSTTAGRETQSFMEQLRARVRAWCEQIRPKKRAFYDSDSHLTAGVPCYTRRMPLGALPLPLRPY